MKRLRIYYIAMVTSLMLVSCHSSKKTVLDDVYNVGTSETVAPPKEEVKKSILGFTIGDGDNERLYEEVRRWYGTPYRYGGKDESGTDCSGMVMVVYQRVYGKRIERNSAKMMERNCRKIDKSELREGDLVFFGTSRRINHVGIYLKNGRFIHASSSKGVIINSLDEPYYIRTYICSGRVK